MGVFSPLRRQILRTFPPLTRSSPGLSRKRYFSQNSLPTLSYSELFVPGLFSEKAFKTAWTDYQTGLVAKLSTLTAGTNFEGSTALDIAISCSRQADLAATFNYASQAYNNHFFFESITPNNPQPEMTPNFTAYIDSTFTGVEALKAELIATATAMFGCGWVWLAFDQSHNLRILCTYNAGTPYGASHRRQSTDMNTGVTLGSTADAYTSPLRRAAQGTQASWVIPVLNVNCWEHAWVEDFGVMGKEKYLEAWWNRIDWSVVQSRCPNKASPRAFAES